MLSRTAQVTILLALAFYAILLAVLLRKKRLDLRYALLWIFSGILMLILAVFPGILPSFAQTVGVYDDTNALFALVLFCLILILMSLTSIVSVLSDKLKKLTQANALLEKRLRELAEREAPEK